MFFTDKMPKNCYNCPCASSEWNTCNIDSNIKLDGHNRPKECPLQDIKLIRDAILRVTQLYLIEYEDTYLLHNGINQTELSKEEYELLKEWLNNEK